VSETIDFTAPTGYLQLCVSVNGNEECGFKQVSTSFALNFVRDILAQDEILDQDIHTESECISGKVNTLALLNPNIQDTFQQVIDPAIYKRGITRICSTGNPGSGTDSDRFVRVGDCGNPNFGCWLDTVSVDKALTTENIGITEGTLDGLKIIKNNLLLQNEDISFFDEVEFKDALAKLEADLSKVNFKDRSEVLAMIALIDENLQKAFWNYQRAELFTLKGKLFADASIDLRGFKIGRIDEKGSDEPPVEETQQGYLIVDIPNSNDVNQLQFNGEKLDIFITTVNFIWSHEDGNYQEGQPVSNGFFKRVGRPENNKVFIEWEKVTSKFNHVRSELAKIDGANYNADKTLGTCEIYFIKGGEVITDGQEVEIVSAGELLLQIQNCPTLANAKVTFTYSSIPDALPIVQEYPLSGFQNNRFEIPLSESSSPDHFQLALGTFSAEVINYNTVIDQTSFQYIPNVGEYIYFFVEDM